MNDTHAKDREALEAVILEELESIAGYNATGDQELRLTWRGAAQMIARAVGATVLTPATRPAAEPTEAEVEAAAWAILGVAQPSGRFDHLGEAQRRNFMGYARAALRASWNLTTNEGE